ncbi:MAG: cytidine deaminase [Bacteroidota bacterium]|nr:cytidine deaminase [Bacteroidota bacterium]
MKNEIYTQLAEKAVEMKKFSQCAYSNFHVGAALLAKDGTVFTGCNIESSSYSLTICAERVAIFKAISEGVKEFDAIAISSDYEGFCSPCGSCRQIISDLCGSIDIILVNNKNETKIYNTADMLPYAFGDDVLNS